MFRKLLNVYDQVMNFLAYLLALPVALVITGVFVLVRTMFKGLLAIPDIIYTLFAANWVSLFIEGLYKVGVLIPKLFKWALIGIVFCTVTPILMVLAPLLIFPLGLISIPLALFVDSKEVVAWIIEDSKALWRTLKGIILYSFKKVLIK
jgi:hypothetical protein